MEVINTATNSGIVTCVWPDGTTQMVTLAPDASVTVPGVVLGGSTLMDSYDHCWQVVRSDPLQVSGDYGFTAHETYHALTFFLSGFFAAIPFLVVWLGVWAILQGFKLRPPTAD